MAQWLRKLLPVLLAGALFGYGWHSGAEHMDKQWQEEVRSEYIKKSKAREETQSAVDAISREYQERLLALESSSDKLVADLRGDNKRLRVRIKSLSSTAAQGACGRESDGRAELDDRDAKRILAVTQKADAWIKALQKTIRELQESK